jgi:hypothetical protein
MTKSADLAGSKRKTCLKCGKTFERSATYFPKTKATKDGLRTWCKPCYKAAVLRTPGMVRRRAEAAARKAAKSPNPIPTRAPSKQPSIAAFVALTDPKPPKRASSKA